MPSRHTGQKVARIYGPTRRVSGRRKVRVVAWSSENASGASCSCSPSCSLCWWSRSHTPQARAVQRVVRLYIGTCPRPTPTPTPTPPVQTAPSHLIAHERATLHMSCTLTMVDDVALAMRKDVCHSSAPPAASVVDQFSFGAICRSMPAFCAPWAPITHCCASSACLRQLRCRCAHTTRTRATISALLSTWNSHQPVARW